MKPYFTKHIPVEGEIKEGDFFLSKWRREHKFVWYIQVGSITDTHYISVQNQPYSKEDAETKVKLFLCSRDIQVGDEIYSDFDNTPLGKSGVNAQGINYKVIGEVSPNAIWVKEGMEFEEGDIQFFYNGISLPTDPIKFKCPTCNTFH